ncbi:MAG: hypothetical protein NVS2B7_22120 [Herpetosiphon sp.]
MEDMAATPIFGDALRHYRLAAGLTQEALAERAGLSVRAITDLERGINRTPRKDTLTRLATALDLSAADHAVWDAARRRSGAVSVPSPARWAAAEHAPPFVGREQELRALDLHLTDGTPPLLLLAGEPGIGKSRLLREVSHHASRSGLRVLLGGCEQRGGQEPFAPLVHALARYLREAPLEQVRANLLSCAWLVRLLPEVAPHLVEPLPTMALPVEQERRLMFDAVVRFLRNVAGPRGTLLLLDDLQWAGADALSLLRTLAHAAVGTRLRLVGAYRDTEVTPQSPLSVMLADLAEAGLARQRHIGVLGLAESRRLLGGLLGTRADTPDDSTPSDEIVERLLRRANGVPFFLVSCAQGMRAVGMEEATAGEVPWTVAQSIRQRVTVLPVATQEVLGMGAVLGRDSSRAILASVASRTEEDVLLALEPAARVGLVEEVGAHGYRFVHDIIREVVADDLGAGRRTLLHRRAADILAARPDPPITAVAYHYLEAEAWASALPYLLQAADRAARAYAHAEALDVYAQAGAVCDRLGESALSMALVAAENRGLINYNLMQLRPARLDFDRMAVIGRQVGNCRQEGMALVHRGMAAWMDHAFAEAETTYRAALAVAGTDIDDVRLAASFSLGHLCQSLNRQGEARELFEAAAALVERVDDPYLQALYGHVRAFPAIWHGRFGDALAILDHSREAAERSGQEIVRLQQTWIEALPLAATGRYEQSLALLDQMLAAGERCGDVLWRGRCLNTMGWIAAELQDHRFALKLNRLALQAAQDVRMPDPEVENNTRLNLGDSLMALGRLDEAAAQYQIVRRVVENPTTEEQWLLWRYAQHLFHSSGELGLVRGDGAKALADAEACLRLAEASDSRKNIVKGRRLRGQVFLAQGHLQQAEQELAAALELAQDVGNPPQLWKTYVAIGQLRQLQGRAADGVAAYRAAVLVIEDVAADLTDPTRRTVFLCSPHIAGIRQRATID